MRSDKSRRSIHRSSFALWTSAHHGDAIDELAQLEQGIAVAEPVVEAAQQEIAREAGVLDLAKFNELAAPHVKAATAPWLRQYQAYPPGGDYIECVGVWDDEKGGVRPATEEEIAAGIWYPDMAAYRRAQGGDVTFTDREKTNGSQGAAAGSDG